MSFDRLIRFEDPQGNVCQGNLSDEVPLHAIKGAEVNLLHGDFQNGYSISSEKRVVAKLLSPLETTPVVICIGINYKQHAAEAGGAVPLDPVVFIKPADALTGPVHDIPIHPDAQSMLDYEGELCVVIGKDAKNLTLDNALDCVLGYTAGNDVSARYFNIAARCGGQFCYAKSFDGFAPIGPCIASSKLVPDPSALQLTTHVNGELRQNSGTSEMVWTVQEVLVHLSRGTTLRKGTVVMMGTPPGVGWFMKPEPLFLSDKDVVDVRIEGIGNIANRVVFAN